MKKKNGPGPDRKVFTEVFSRLEPHGAQILERWSESLREELDEPGALIYRTICSAVSLPQLREGNFPELYRAASGAAGELARSGVKFSDILTALQLLRESCFPFLLKDTSPEDLMGAILATDRLNENVLAIGSESFLEGAGQGEKYRGMDAIRGLTKRETEIIQWVAEGYKNREIADQLGISVKTVETHRANIMNKLGLRNLSQLIRYAIQKGMIKIEKG